MVNPFASIITSGMKTLHQNMIDALLEDSSCTVACRIIYVGSQLDEIPGTYTIDPIGGKAPGVYIHGGPSFNHQRDDVQRDEQTETIYLMPIWDSREWILTPLASALVQTPNMYIQTLSKISTAVTLRQATELVVDTAIESKVRHTFVREGEPEPCGFGASTHIVTMWKRK